MDTLILTIYWENVYLRAIKTLFSLISLFFSSILFNNKDSSVWKETQVLMLNKFMMFSMPITKHVFIIVIFNINQNNRDYYFYHNWATLDYTEYRDTNSIYMWREI